MSKEKATNKKPTHKVIMGSPRPNDKTFWRDIGAGWTNSDGSINIKLEAMPLGTDFTLQIREIDEE